MCRRIDRYQLLYDRAGLLRSASDHGRLREHEHFRERPLPPRGSGPQPGLFQYGLNQVQNPFGSNFVCVTGPGNRIGISFLFGSNYVGLQADLNAPAFAPFPITAGSTWNFQAWHRDHCGAGHLTDGLEITFTP